MKLKVYKNSFVQNLTDDIKKNIDLYLTGGFDLSVQIENGENYFEIDAPWLNEADLMSLNNISENQMDEVADHRDASVVFNALKDMPPDVARDPRIWTTLCHTHCLQYIRQRNHKFLFAEDKEEVINTIKSRFFINGTRSYERSNGLARLWWYGFIVSQTNLTLDKALKVQLSYTDFRQQTLERPLVFSHKEIRKGVLDVSVKLDDIGDEFYRNRKEYRAVFKDINERATRIFFPGMSHERLTKFVTARIERVRQNP